MLRNDNPHKSGQWRPPGMQKRERDQGGIHGDFNPVSNILLKKKQKQKTQSTVICSDFDTVERCHNQNIPLI